MPVAQRDSYFSPIGLLAQPFQCIGLFNINAYGVTKTDYMKDIQLAIFITIISILFSLLLKGIIPLLYSFIHSFLPLKVWFFINWFVFLGFVTFFGGFDETIATTALTWQFFNAHVVSIIVLYVSFYTLTRAILAFIYPVENKAK